MLEIRLNTTKAEVLWLDTVLVIDDYHDWDLLSDIGLVRGMVEFLERNFRRNHPGEEGLRITITLSGADS